MLKRFLILATMDALLVLELLGAFWYASLDMTEVALTFTKVFLPLAILTVIGARFALRRWAPADVRDEYCPVGIVGPFKERVSPLKVKN